MVPISLYRGVYTFLYTGQGFQATFSGCLHFCIHFLLYIPMVSDVFSENYAFFGPVQTLKPSKNLDPSL
jgi:hypothetical protein